MRIIGHLNKESAAQLFVDYLYVKGVDSEMEWDGGERWEIWVHEEEQFALAKQLLGEFAANPGAPKFADVGLQAKKMRREAAEKEDRYRKRVKSRAETVAALRRPKIGKLTMGLMMVCVGIFLLMMLNESMNAQIRHYLSISTPYFKKDDFEKTKEKEKLPEVRQGQIWRLVTPILMHGSLIHIFFNLWCMKDLGSILEWRLGWRSLLGLILATAVVSNLAQYYTSGPSFLGISGVVFGLLGFLWIKGKFDPNFGLELPRPIVFLMLIWLVLGYMRVLDSFVGATIANNAHLAGLIAGMACAFLPFWSGRR